MKKSIFIIFIITLIIGTTITKNSSKKIEKNIFQTQENIRMLNDKLELLLLDYNYLTSPKKLIEYQSQYFENDLTQVDIENLKKLNLKNNKINLEELN